jgi:hypothetical protein
MTVVEHGGNPVEAKSVEFEFFKPESNVLKEKSHDFTSKSANN